MVSPLRSRDAVKRAVCQDTDREEAKCTASVMLDQPLIQWTYDSLRCCARRLCPGPFWVQELCVCIGKSGNGQVESAEEAWEERKKPVLSPLFPILPSNLSPHVPQPAHHQMNYSKGTFSKCVLLNMSPKSDFLGKREKMGGFLLGTCASSYAPLEDSLCSLTFKNPEKSFSKGLK